jgi:hypothetical protein
MDVVENQQYITKWVEDTIINGLKETLNTEYMPKVMVEDTIQNGVKQIYSLGALEVTEKEINNTLQNGVRDTQSNPYENESWVEGVIKGGVKETKTPNKDGDIQSTLEWMYKNNYQDDYNGSKMINNVIENGVKEIYHYKGFRPRNIGDIIENGVKETQPLPDQSGELIGYGNYYHGKEDRTKPFNEYLNEAIEFGVIAKTP